MRLIETTTLTLHEFLDEDSIPPYAILSHRWGAEEIDYKDLLKQRNKDSKRLGWGKVHDLCRLAQADGLEYAWIDTAGIDKRSSAELQEAINSMFKWYRNSKVCYAFLDDVPDSITERTNVSIIENDSAFRASKWFTRGWTLQELLAPKRMLFFGASRHQSFGTRDELATSISTVTGIDGDFVKRFRPYNELQEIHRAISPWYSECSVAQIMFWASRRETTRKEDMAYCLMGLFGINMPLLYGEGGQNAFLRLQLQIMQAHNDESLFAWYAFDEQCYTGLLAPSPRCFAYSRDVHVDPRLDQGRASFSMTNNGLRIKPLLRQLPDSAYRPDSCYLMPLNCGPPTGKGLWAAIILRRMNERNFERFVCKDVVQCDEKATRLPSAYPRQLRDYLELVPDRLLPEDYVRHEIFVRQSTGSTKAAIPPRLQSPYSGDNWMNPPSGKEELPRVMTRADIDAVWRAEPSNTRPARRIFSFDESPIIN